MTTFDRLPNEITNIIDGYKNEYETHDLAAFISCFEIKQIYSKVVGRSKLSFEVYVGSNWVTYKHRILLHYKPFDKYIFVDYMKGQRENQPISVSVQDVVENVYIECVYCNWYRATNYQEFVELKGENFLSSQDYYKCKRDIATVEKLLGHERFNKFVNIDATPILCKYLF